MFSPTNPEHLRTMLLHMAAASVGAPQGKERTVRYLRAALVLIEDEDLRTSPASLDSPGISKALEELAFTLSMASDHAAFLVERAVTGRSR